MRRIDVGEVLAAYREVGVNPTQRTWHRSYPDGEGKPCYCPLAVLLAKETGRRFEGDEELAAWEVAEGLGLNRSYVSGFIDGVDGEDGEGTPYSTLIPYKTGYADGKRVWQAVAIEYTGRETVVSVEKRRQCQSLGSFWCTGYTDTEDEVCSKCVREARRWSRGEK